MLNDNFDFIFWCSLWLNAKEQEKSKLYLQHFLFEEAYVAFRLA